MASIFLDTNYFFEIFEKDKEKISDLEGNNVYASPLSYHIFSYTKRLKTPNQPLINSLGTISPVSLNEVVLSRSLLGPTHDLEDNIQLQSAAESGCDLFLTHDKNLLKLGYFGKTKITDRV